MLRVGAGPPPSKLFKAPQKKPPPAAGEGSFVVNAAL